MAQLTRWSTAIFGWLASCAVAGAERQMNSTPAIGIFLAAAQVIFGLFSATTSKGSRSASSSSSLRHSRCSAGRGQRHRCRPDFADAARYQDRQSGGRVRREPRLRLALYRRSSPNDPGFNLDQIPASIDDMRAFSRTLLATIQGISMSGGRTVGAIFRPGTGRGDGGSLPAVFGSGFDDDSERLMSRVRQPASVIRCCGTFGLAAPYPIAGVRANIRPLRAPARLAAARTARSRRRHF